LGGCSQKESFSPYLSGDLGLDTLFEFKSLRSIESDWANRGGSAGVSWASKRAVVCAWQGYLSRSFLWFTALPDSLVEVTSASLYLYATRVDGDPVSHEFGVYTLADTLKQLELFWGTMPEPSTTQVAAFFPPAASEDSVEVDVTDVVSSWVKRETPNLGFVIKDLDEMLGDTGVLVEFASREVSVKQSIADEDTVIYDLRPALRIAYVDTAGQDQLAISIATVDAFADTLITPFDADTLRILCGNGFPSRAFVRFDFSGIPREATVTRSVLKLHTDLENSSFDSIGIICHAVLDAEWNGFETSFGLTGTGSTTLKADEMSGGEAVSMVITPLVQPVVSRQQESYGFLIKPVSETFDLDFVRFFSAENPDTNMRPRLEIHYAMPAPPPYLTE
jgi:hypothetical protein